MITNDSSPRTDIESSDGKYQSSPLSDIPMECKKEESSVKPTTGVYRTASISSIKNQDRINLMYDNNKESLKKIYLQANSDINNATTDSKH